MEENIEPVNGSTTDNSAETHNANETKTPQSFAESFSGDDSKYVGDKGWKTPSDMLKSYRELETFSSNRVSLPKDGDEESWRNLYNKIGMPEKEEDYNVEGIDEQYKKDLQALLFKNHVLPKDANNLVKDYEVFAKSQIEAQQKLAQENSKKEYDEVVSEWGDKADKNKELVKRGAKLLGLDDDVLTTLELAIGTKNFMHSMQKLGESISEDNINFGAKGGVNEQPLSYAEFFKQL